MNTTRQLGDIVFLCKRLEQIYIMCVRIDTDPTYTLSNAKDDLLKEARQIKQEIGERQF